MSEAGERGGSLARYALPAIIAVVMVLVVVLWWLGGAAPEPAAGPTRSPHTTVRSVSPAPASSDPAARSGRSSTDPESGLPWIAVSTLPREAQEVLERIDRGGPHAYAKDGSTFGNFEGRLPKRPRGFYREYTVRTPGESDRGARRIVTGDDDRQVFWTADHYESFARVRR